MDLFEEGVSRNDAIQARVKSLKSLLGGIQEVINIETPFSVLYGCNTFVGERFFGNVE